MEPHNLSLTLDQQMIAKYKTKNSQEYQDILKGRKRFITGSHEEFTADMFVLIQEFDGEQYTQEMCLRVISHIDEGFEGQLICSIKNPEVSHKIPGTMTNLNMIDDILNVHEFEHESTETHHIIKLFFPNESHTWKLDRTDVGGLWVKQ